MRLLFRCSVYYCVCCQFKCVTLKVTFNFAPCSHSISFDVVFIKFFIVHTTCVFVYLYYSRYDYESEQL